MRRLIPHSSFAGCFFGGCSWRATVRRPAPAHRFHQMIMAMPVLKAMLAELKRSQEKLQLGQLQRPYYIDYQVTEIQDNIADATLGALRTDQVNSGRLVRVVVRIGDYKQDSYFGEGMGAVEVMPTDNDELALRRQLWLATDKAYKSALSGFTEKQAALKNVETETTWRTSRRRSRRSQSATWPSWMWTWTNGSRRSAATSDLFRSDPSLEMSSAMLNFRVLNRYFVNTEGTVARNGKSIYTLLFSAADQADDGMHLERSHGWVVTKGRRAAQEGRSGGGSQEADWQLCGAQESSAGGRRLSRAGAVLSGRGNFIV